MSNGAARARLGLGAGPAPARSRRCSITWWRKEIERKALGAEVLHLYREINLIYSFSEKLAALLDVERVASLTLQEARHLIVATDGADHAARRRQRRADVGRRLRRRDAGAVAVPPRPRHHRRDRRDRASARSSTTWTAIRGASPSTTVVKALICAPLKVGERVIGVIALGSTLPMAYTAAELKLLNTLALQTATAIENARLFERTVQAARERERLLALHQEAEVARAKLESELKLAARIQADLFPASTAGDRRATSSPPATARRGNAAATTTMRIAVAHRRRRARAAVRGRRRGQGPAGGARDEQHAGDAAGPARAHGDRCRRWPRMPATCCSRRRRPRSTSPRRSPISSRRTGAIALRRRRAPGQR